MIWNSEIFTLTISHRRARAHARTHTHSKLETYVSMIWNTDICEEQPIYHISLHSASCNLSESSHFLRIPNPLFNNLSSTETQ